MTEQTTPTPLYERLQGLAMQVADAAFALREGKEPTIDWQEVALAISEASQQAEREHLMDGVVTAAQQRRIARLLQDGNVQELRIGYRPFDLAEGWITVTVTYSTGAPIYGGISPEGAMHT